MRSKTINEWIELIRPIFPPKAIIDVFDQPHDDLLICIDWKLENDKSRSNKRSKLIMLIITHEAIEDCRDYKIAGKKIKSFVEQKFAVFDPDHDNPREMRPPAVKWLIKSDYLN